MQKRHRRPSLPKKIAKWFLYLLIALALAAGGIYLSAGFIVKKAVSVIVPQITQTAASLEDAEISLFRGRVALKGLKIGNPAGFSDNALFELGSVSVSFEPRSLLKRRIVVNEIKVEETRVRAEINRQGEINLLQLNQNVQSYLKAGAAPKAAAADSAPVQQAGKTILIQDLRISGSQLSLGAGGKDVALGLPDIRQKNIGAQKETSLPQAAAQILSDFSMQALQGIARVGDELLGQGLKEAKKTLEAGENALKEGKRQAKDAAAGLKKLFD